MMLGNFFGIILSTFVAEGIFMSVIFAVIWMLFGALFGAIIDKKIKKENRQIPVGLDDEN